jgi:FtsH-binding integral membrane protein
MATQAETIRLGDPGQRRERLFYTAMAAAFVITVFAGFSRTWFLRPVFHPEPLIPLLYVHGFIFTLWIALLLTQTTLIATKRTRTHMRLGIAGGLLASLMILIGTVTAIVRAKGPSPIPGVNPLSFLTIPLGDMLVFGILVGTAFYFRRKVDTHKRLMLLATIALLPAAVARLPISFIETGGPLVFYGLSDLFIVPCLIYDFVSRGRPHRATVLGGALIVISHPLRLVIGSTHAWLAFATWLTHWT